MDIGDCMAALAEEVDSGRVDGNRVAAVGGSHGGFLTGHAIGQHAEAFKAAVMRNPVLDLALMVHVRSPTVPLPFRRAHVRLSDVVFCLPCMLCCAVCCTCNCVPLEQRLQVTDIPDWCHVEVLGAGAETRAAAKLPLTADARAAMLAKSPIAHVANVRTPTLMFLGAADRRAPHIDGLAYATALKCGSPRC